MNKSLHLISFDVPSPPDYGGVIDVYYKIKALKEAGIDVILHAFQYGRATDLHLNELCAEVYYYKRHTTPSRLISSLPYIVCSRDSDVLQKRINNDNHPVLMEGLHSTMLLHTKSINAERCVVRAHNIEHNYYEFLSKNTTSLFRRIYFSQETEKLKKYEPVLSNVNLIAAISETETKYFNAKYNNSAFLLPAFHPYGEVISSAGSGTFALFHGNLSVPENNKAALFLTEEVFNGYPFPLVIAGHRPSKDLLKAVAVNNNVSIAADPAPHDMQRLLHDAHVHVLPGYQQSGIKLKLLAALFSGRHIIANKLMTAGTGAERLCMHAETSSDFRNQINAVLNIPFSEEMKSMRAEMLETSFSNKKNASLLISKLPFQA